MLDIRTWLPKLIPTNTKLFDACEFNDNEELFLLSFALPHLSGIDVSCMLQYARHQKWALTSMQIWPYSYTTVMYAALCRRNSRSYSIENARLGVWSAFGSRYQTPI